MKDAIMGCIYLAFLGTLLGCCLIQFGNHWTLGRYFMPRSLVNETGMQYRDGSQIGAITLACIRADVEEEVFLIGLGVVALIFARCVYQEYRTNVWMRRHREEMAKLAETISTLRTTEMQC